MFMFVMIMREPIAKMVGQDMILYIFMVAIVMRDPILRRVCQEIIWMFEELAESITITTLERLTLISITSLPVEKSSMTYVMRL